MNNSPGTKLIRVSEETHRRLNEHGNVTDSFDDVIKKLLDFYDSHKGRRKP